MQEAALELGVAGPSNVSLHTRQKRVLDDKQSPPKGKKIQPAATPTKVSIQGVQTRRQKRILEEKESPPKSKKQPTMTTPKQYQTKPDKVVSKSKGKKLDFSIDPLDISR